MPVRSPFVALFVTLLEVAVLAPLLTIPVVIFASLGLPSEVSLFYGVAAFAIAGFIGGRSGTFAFAAFATAFLGAFIGYLVFFAIVPPIDLLFGTIHAAVAGATAWASAAWRMAKVTPEVMLENQEKRRCRMCGARVGPKARRCWSCRASLERIV